MARLVAVSEGLAAFGKLFAVSRALFVVPVLVVLAGMHMRHRAPQGGVSTTPGTGRHTRKVASAFRLMAP